MARDTRRKADREQTHAARAVPSCAEGGHGRGVAVGPWPSFPTDCWLRLLLLLVEWGGLKTVPDYFNLENLMCRTHSR